MVKSKSKQPTSRDSPSQGPRKSAPRGRGVSMYSTHKRRSGWFAAREAWPLRDVGTYRLVAERERVAGEMAAATLPDQWAFAGPSNIGGRMTSLVCAPNDPDLLIAGAAGGGPWRSSDGGLYWQALWHQEPTLNIGALAIDPNAPQLVYCGTGEANLSADSHPGVGVFVSRDFGDSWEPLADAWATGIPMRIGTIAVDPFDSSHIRLGGLSHGVGNDGMFSSLDGGQSWTREGFVSVGGYRCHEVLFDPHNAGTIFACVTARGTLSGIWRTRDGGANWTHLVNGLPDPSFLGRSSIAMAPSDPAVLYAQIADHEGGVLGIYASTDGGDTWTNVAGRHFRNERQMSYNNTIVVHPHDPNHVLCGGVDIHLSTNGGRTWSKVTEWSRDRGEPDYAHADQHKLLMPAARPGLVYAMNDGGCDLSLDGGESWENRSNGLAVTMYYDLETAQSDGRMYGGGCQDNGTNITETGGTDDHFMIAGGDGGWITIDPLDRLHLYASSQRMSIYRFRASDGWVDVSPLHPNSPERRSMWMVFIAMDPGDPQRVFTATQRVWRTEDDGDNWEAVSDVLDGSDVTAIEVCLTDGQRVYVGTENGGIFRSYDGGDSWSGDLAGPLLPGRTITRVRSSPVDPDTLYATVANMDNSHVFRSRDGGDTWEDMDQGRLPRVAHHGIAISTANPSHVFVCNDLGVYASTDGGDNWTRLTGNLPNAMVVDLVYHRQDNRLTAATYGRSLWHLGLG